MQTVRSPAVAGSFYPGNRKALITSIDAMLGNARSVAPCPKVIIAPHAGHIYSGPVAAMAYRRLEHRKQDITRVVLLGPSHHVGFRGIAVTGATSYATPLGEIPLATDAIQEVINLPETGFLDSAHDQEHSLEVHLPFLQRVLDEFKLVPLVVGDAGKEVVASVIDQLWGGPETLIVISSDLSHFHDYSTAQRIDTRTSHKITDLCDNLTGEEACGCKPLNGLLYLARKKNLTVQQVDVRNSGDTAGTRDRVVGYGSYVILEPEESQNEEFNPELRQRMLKVATDAILHPLLGNGSLRINPLHFPLELQHDRATFVTLLKHGTTTMNGQDSLPRDNEGVGSGRLKALNINGSLRGCIGSLVAHRPLIVDIAQNASAAAFEDPRFRPISLKEFHQVDIHISILSTPEKLDISSREELLSQLEPGVDGLILEENGRRATYLPSVWEQLPDPDLFIAELRSKAGLPPHTWSSNTTVYRYRTEEFSH